GYRVRMFQAGFERPLRNSRLNAQNVIWLHNFHVPSAFALPPNVQVKGPRNAVPSERSERLEPLVRPRHGVEPAAKRECSMLLECGLEHTRAGFQVEELEDAGRREPAWEVKM
ncbi:MAG: hypothetical protein ACRESV_04820, partial [Nevskiales bacterium]